MMSPGHEKTERKIEVFQSYDLIQTMMLRKKMKVQKAQNRKLRLDSEEPLNLGQYRLKRRKVVW